MRAALVSWLWALGCSTPGEVCLDVRADLSLNLYNGAAHATDLYLYPLSDPLSFSQMSADVLLGGARPAGMTEPEPLRVTLLPGQSRAIRHQFPEETRAVGLVADYYREKDESGGPRTAVVRASCRRMPAVILSVSDLVIE